MKLYSHLEDIEEFGRRGYAVVYHHFDDHRYCQDWCPHKRKGGNPSGDNKYRCLEEDKELFGLIVDILERYITGEKLAESHHTYNTQKNKAINKSVTKYAPKDRCYAKTMSLTARTHVAAGIDAVGRLQFWMRVLERVDVNMTPTLRTALTRQDKRKEYIRARQKKPEVKKHRAKSKNETIKKETEADRKARSQGLVYGAGIAFNDVENNKTKKRKAPSKPKRKGRRRKQRRTERTSGSDADTESSPESDDESLSDGKPAAKPKHQKPQEIEHPPAAAAAAAAENNDNEVFVENNDEKRLYDGQAAAQSSHAGAAATVSSILPITSNNRNENLASKSAKKPSRERRPCPHCGGTDHQRRSSGKCPMNKNKKIPKAQGECPTVYWAFYLENTVLTFHFLL